MIKRVLFLLVTFIVALPVVLAAVTDCGTVSASDVLTQNISGAGTCLTLDTANVVLDCQGFTVTYNTGGGDVSRGVLVLASNVTVENCILTDGNVSGSSGSGVEVSGVGDAKIINNSIQASGASNNYGVYVTGGDASRANVTGNTVQVTATSFFNVGIYALSGANATIVSNAVNVSGSAGDSIGVRVQGASGAQVSQNEIYTGSAGTQNDGLQIDSSPLAIVFDNTVSASGESSNRGVVVTGSGGSVFRGMTINTAGSSGLNHGLLVQSAGENSTFADLTITAQGSTNSEGVRVTGSANASYFENVTVNSSSGNQVSLVSSSAGHRFVNATLEGSTNWVVTDGTSNANFTGVTFSSGSGSIRVLPEVVVSSSSTVSQARVNITANNSFINSSALPFLNTSARITLSGLTAPFPNIVADFNDNGSYEDCPTEVCTLESYAGGEAVFTVTHFTSFAVQDAPTPPIPEFSTLALMVLLVVVLGGFVVMRRN